MSTITFFTVKIKTRWSVRWQGESNDLQTTTRKTKTKYVEYNIEHYKLQTPVIDNCQISYKISISCVQQLAHLYISGDAIHAHSQYNSLYLGKRKTYLTIQDDLWLVKKKQSSPKASQMQKSTNAFSSSFMWNTIPNSNLFLLIVYSTSSSSILLLLFFYFILSLCLYPTTTKNSNSNSKIPSNCLFKSGTRFPIILSFLCLYLYFYFYHFFYLLSVLFLYAQNIRLWLMTMYRFLFN